ncbi:MAG: OsmC family protein [Bifidobacteriaceae bacterium]|jgi:uncharacterized OsmC-like protein|nr:OsmC family protein [Bifidobacteriaceae bacterium]
MPLSELADYIPFKRELLATPSGPSDLKLAARVSVEGRAGVRKIRIRDHLIVSDVRHVGGGSDLGPIPGELGLAALAGCLSHGYVIQIAKRGYELRKLEVAVEEEPTPDGFDTPIGLVYHVTVDTDAPEAELKEIFDVVAEKSFVHRLLAAPTSIRGGITNERQDAR